MGKVRTTTYFVEVEGDFGLVDGVELICEKCGRREESAGTSDRSIKRCATLLHDHCDLGEDNFYIID